LGGHGALLGGAKLTKSSRGDGTTWLPTDVYFENCISKPCQVGHLPFQCSAVITTSYVRQQFRWSTLFSTAIANLYKHFD